MYYYQLLVILGEKSVRFDRSERCGLNHKTAHHKIFFFGKIEQEKRSSFMEGLCNKIVI